MFTYKHFTIVLIALELMYVFLQITLKYCFMLFN